MARLAAPLVLAALVLLCAGCPNGPAIGPAPGPGGRVQQPGALAQTLTVPKDGSILQLVPAGRFRMGDPIDPRRVTLRPCYIDRYEVTNEQYARVLADVRANTDSAWRHPDQPHDKKGHVPSLWPKKAVEQYRLPPSQRAKDFWESPLAAPRHPVVGVDWFDAYAYAKWAGKRLPTEAEWERAARGTDERPYPWGTQPPEQGLTFRANYFSTFLAADGFKFTAPVGSFPNGASPVGCLNLGGNAAEWCGDWFGPPPSESRLTDPVGPLPGVDRVVKGGAWNLAPAMLRSYTRMRMPPSDRAAGVGFRCARDAAPATP